MEAVFHEKQEGSLCAQHCLNALLQGQFYSPIDLSDVAMELDTAERHRMAEGGEDSPEYIQFLQQPSINMDDSGFFSVQVIAKCLSVWSLELINYNSNDERAVRTRAAPISGSAYICNYREHWFTIRRLGTQWFNLNSLLEFPELISNSYLREFLAQLQTEGYTIFLVVGDLPDCDADLVLQAVPAVQAVRPRLLQEIQGGGGRGRGAATGGSSSDTSGRDEEADLEAALALSLAENVAAPGGGQARIDNEELQRALGRGQAASLDDELEMALNMSRSMETEPAQPQVSEEDEMQQAIAASLEAGASVISPGGGGQGAGWGGRLRQQEQEEEDHYKEQEDKKRREEEEEQAQLEQALAMSMQVDQEETKTKPSPTKAKAAPKIDPVQTAWPKLKNPPPGSVSSDSPAQAGPSQGGKAGPSQGGRAGPSQGASAQPPRPQLKNYLSGKEEETAQKEAEKRPMGPGQTLGGGSSVGGGRGASSSGDSNQPNPEEIRRRRMAFLDKLQKSPKEENK